MRDKQKRVSVIGLGYIGLPTSALLAEHGYQVLGVDVNTSVVETINQGNVHIVEPGLDAYVSSGVAAGRLRAFADVQASDIYMICVPTPFDDSGEILQPNLSHVYAAAAKIAKLLKAGDLVILESTSPVGTTEQIKKLLVNLGATTEKIHIAYCPERVLPGSAMKEILGNDRVVGGITTEATERVADFYRSFVHGEVFETDAKTAEMCKLTENSFRDVNIAFANELSMLCAAEGVDVWRLIQLANRHPRVNILQPGVGVGGHCIAVDPWFIVARDQLNSRLIRTAREVNNYKTDWVVDRIREAVTNVQVTNVPKIACLGLAFKPDIDDLRESPAVEVLRALVREGFDVVAVEPNIPHYEECSLLNVNRSIDECNVIAVLVRHREFLYPEIRGRLVKAGALDFCGALS